MSQTDSFVERLKSTPITNLSVERSAFRRSLACKGFSNLVDVLELTDPEIDRMFNLDEACKIESLQCDFRNNPEAFAKKALEKAPRAHSLPDPQPTRKANASRPAAHSHRPERYRPLANRSVSDPSSYLSLSFVSKLLELEGRAKEIFDDLNDRQENVVVYQAFDAFATEFDEISDNFEQLFRYFHYQGNIKTALDVIDRYLKNIFLIYVADRARTFHEKGFWNSFFPTIHIPHSNPVAQTSFKQLFYTGLQDKNMPVYHEDESSRHFFLTALLHGGLSQSSWKDLWETSILPLARTSRLFGNGSQTDTDGRSILKTILDSTNAYTPHKTELDVLGKAPVALAAPLLESALQVGMQVVANDNSGAGPTMLTSYGLPDIAIDALIDLENDRTDAGSNGATRTARPREFLALPKADLQLDISTGNVALHWNKQQFPLSKNRRRIDYYVDEKKMAEQPLGYSVGKCMLDAMRIDVAPRPQYEVALKLVELDERSGAWKEIASLEQNFERLNPGCFEFIQDAKGTFRLRRSSDRITKTRSIAYIVDKGLNIDPGPGMELRESYVSRDAWGGTTIYVFSVSPGSGGSIVKTKDDGTQEEIAVWQENYRSNIDKTGVLGSTIDGVDLYGVIPDEEDTGMANDDDVVVNIGLPTFYIEALNGRDALDDLDIICQCDGETASIKRSIIWEAEEGEDGAARIKLSPTESSYFVFNRHINLCTIEARQRSAGDRAIFKYKFSVAPIQEFHLESIALNGYELDATYTFESSEDMYVIQNQTIQNKDEQGRFVFTEPLKSSILPIRIVSSRTAKTTDALIDLAALDISIPHSLIDLARKRPLCLPDTQDGYNAGQCDVRTANWSQSRAAYVSLGYIPLYFKELARPSTSNFSVYENAQHFLQTDEERVRDLPLALCVYYGYKRSGKKLERAYAETTLMNCQAGFGFTTWAVRYDQQGNAYVKFDAPLRCDVKATFKPINAHSAKRTAKPFTETVNAGEDRVCLPKGIASALQRHRTYEMSLALIDEFDLFDDFSFDDDLEDPIDTDQANGLTTTFTLKGSDHHGR